MIGRIDRVDKAEEDEVSICVCSIISRVKKELNMSEVYYGLALQMLTYLDIVVTHSKSLIGKEAIPAGVLYFHVHNPVVKSKGMLSLDKIEEEIYKSFKMNGLVLDHSNVIQLMDTSLDIENSGKSDIIPAGFKKDGSLLAASKVASREEFFASESSCAPYLSGSW
ncbi:PD-(D/E)XK nuclease family protein [Peribacillus frigoritolerans]|nr:PD-(D/E)XK nuclease family protein [Peribacillus frigoritolerans]